MKERLDDHGNSHIDEEELQGYGRVLKELHIDPG